MVASLGYHHQHRQNSHGCRGQPSEPKPAPGTGRSGRSADFILRWRFRRRVFEPRAKGVRQTRRFEPAKFGLEQIMISLVHVKTCFVNFRSPDTPYR